MAFVEIVNLFTCYGVDVLVLATITCAISQILKTFALKTAPDKVITFLPFAIGLAIYAAYALISGTVMSAEIWKSIPVKGLSVGAVATILCYLYDNLVSGRTPDLRQMVADMLKGFVSDDKLVSTAESIIEAVSEEEIAEIISENAAAGVGREEILAISALIAETLKKH